MMRIIFIVLVLVLVGCSATDFSDYCIEEDNGFYCEISEELQEEITAVANLCSARDGKWTRGEECSGPCIYTDEYICDYPFEDAGEVCVDSNECMDKCIVEEDYILEKGLRDDIPCQELTFECDGCVGRCSEHPVGDFFVFELEGSVIKYKCVRY